MIGYLGIGKFDLKTQAYEGDVAAFPNASGGFGNCAIAACVYDDYKIAILYPGQTYVSSYRRIYSFNTVDNTLTDLTGNFRPGYNSNSSHVDSGPGDAIFLPNKRKIYFFDCCGTASTTDEYDNTYYKPIGAIISYNLTDNTQKTIYVQGYNDAVSGNMFKRGFCWRTADESTVYYYDGLANRQRVVKINTANDTAVNESLTGLGSIDNGLEYSPGQIIAFTGAKPVLFDAYNMQVITDVVIPEAPATPWLRALNKYDNQIISMNDTGTMKLPYVAQEPGVKQPVWTIFAGQQFAGERELPIINKPTIQPYWQTATETFDINLGEYDSYGDYRLLIRSGEK